MWSRPRCTPLPPCSDAPGRGAVRCLIWVGSTLAFSHTLSRARAFSLSLCTLSRLFARWLSLARTIARYLSLSLSLSLLLARSPACSLARPLSLSITLSFSFPPLYLSHSLSLARSLDSLLARSRARRRARVLAGCCALVVCLVAVRLTAACVAVGWDWLLCSWLLRAWLLCSGLLCFLQLTCPRARPTCFMPIVS